jgi:hypothetical protein
MDFGCSQTSSFSNHYLQTSSSSNHFLHVLCSFIFFLARVGVRTSMS